MAKALNGKMGTTPKYKETIHVTSQILQVRILPAPPLKVNIEIAACVKRGVAIRGTLLNRINHWDT